MSDEREHMTPTVALLERAPVDSSAVRSYGYEPTTETLDVEFTPPEGEEMGAVWRYAPVSAADAAILDGAESAANSGGAL